jgi:hypothetical protein
MQNVFNLPTQEAGSVRIKLVNKWACPPKAGLPTTDNMGGASARRLLLFQIPIIVTYHAIALREGGTISLESRRWFDQSRSYGFFANKE